MTNPRDTDAELNTYLQGLDERLRRLIESDFVQDPDREASQLSADAQHIDDAILEVLAAIETQEPSQGQSLVNLNDVVDHATREFVASREHDLAIRITKHPELVGVPHDDELLLAALFRSLQIVSEHGARVTELAIETTTDGERDSIRLTTEFIDRRDDRRPTEQRIVSLSDLLGGMGGMVRIEKREDRLTMSLDFETSVSSL